MANNNMLFSEKQQFRQILLWLFLCSVLALFIWAIIQQLILGKPFGDNPASNSLLIGLTIIPIALIYFFVKLALITQYDTEGISIELSWIIKKRILWKDVESAQFRKYRALREYGGWGYRVSFTGKGQAFCINGSDGLQLRLKDGKKILIGTQDVGMLELAIKKPIAALGAQTQP